MSGRMSGWGPLFIAACIAGSVAGLQVRAQQGTDVTGTWDMTVESESGAGEAVMTLKQDGQKLTGTYKGRMGESGLSGSVRDSSIRFTVNLRFRDMSFTITYSGTVQVDRMQGAVDFGDGKSGTWSARRRPKS